MTGKGDRWGRDSVGRSAPAFLAASTTVLPPLTCTACREAGQHRRQLLFLLQGRPSVDVCFEACAGRRVRRLCPPAVAGSAGCVLPAANFSMSCPLPFSSVCPVQFALFAPVHSMCARIFIIVQTNSLQAARLSRWQLQHGPAVAAHAPVHCCDSYLLFLQSP